MSQILLISDTHFLSRQDLHAFIHQFPHIHSIIHCGDIYPGYRPGDISGLYLCKGNNDLTEAPLIAHFTIDQITFTLTHGHINNYAYNPCTLKQLLSQYPADIICFGHTHIPYIHQDEDVTIVNPGSLTLGRSYPRRNTYAIIETQDQTITFYDAQTHEVIKI